MTNLRTRIIQEVRYKSGMKKPKNSYRDHPGNSVTLPSIDKERYTELPGLEGPFRTKSGRIVYYDPKQGQYYNRDSDMYYEKHERVMDESKDAFLVRKSMSSNMKASVKRADWMDKFKTQLNFGRTPEKNIDWKKANDLYAAGHDPHTASKHYRNPVNEGWLRQGGKEYSANDSEFRHHPNDSVRCPSCRTPILKSYITNRMNSIKDDEGDVQYWTARCKKCDAKLTVFNDGYEPEGNTISEKFEKTKGKKSFADFVKSKKNDNDEENEDEKDTDDNTKGKFEKDDPENEENGEDEENIDNENDDGDEDDDETIEDVDTLPFDDNRKDEEDENINRKSTTRLKTETNEVIVDPETKDVLTDDDDDDNSVKNNDKPKKTSVKKSFKDFMKNKKEK